MRQLSWQGALPSLNKEGLGVVMRKVNQSINSIQTILPEI